MAAFGGDFNHIKATRRQRAHPQQVMPGRQHNARLFGPPHAGRSAAMAAGLAPAHLYKHQSAVAVTNDPVTCAPPATGRSLSAAYQVQPLLLQKQQGFVLGGVTDFFGAGLFGDVWKETHW